MVKNGPESILNALPVLSDLFLTILCGRYYDLPYFTEEKTEVGKG